MQSALGEVLRAEIEVTSLTPEEQASLRIRVAPPEAYRAAGVDYNPVLPSTRAPFERRADGRLFVRLVSDRGVQEPFVDVILEISWATGRLVREYTLLFDPPAAIRARRRRRARHVTAPVIAAAPPAPLPRRRARRRVGPRGARRRAARRRAVAGARAPRRGRAPPRDAKRRAAPPRAARGRARGRSRAATNTASARGDSLSKIAGRTQRPGVSLDQMLVALFRANPRPSSATT